jgi:predicted small lipoprotein YifL
MSDHDSFRPSLILAVCLLSILGGCGQKGGLYLPDEAPAKVPAKPPAAAPAVPPGTPPADDPATRRKLPPTPDPSTAQ